MSPMALTDARQAGLLIGSILDKIGQVKNSVGGTLASEQAFSLAAHGRLVGKALDGRGDDAHMLAFVVVVAAQRSGRRNGVV